ncbi:hypothetical protein ACFYKX_10310 [Cytobacillus sp. FJAT-54145]|uniref:Actin-like protein N-terminal domain-containing protein n=1 Tax=Cytobacillus spartinae TaxID=3299023 RepID=A0ABW6KDN4_9BACI
MNTRAASVDIGNDSIKAFLGVGYNARVLLPNVISEVESRDIVDYEKEVLQGLHVQINSGALKNGKGSYAVGVLATKYKSNDELTSNSEKSESDQPVIMLLTTLAYDTATNTQPDEDGIIDVTYHLSTGLPLAEIKKGKRAAFREKLKKHTHEVTFLQTPQLEGVTVRIRFETVKVNTESYSALVDLTMAEDGSPRNEELEGKTILIHDIGGLSTDAAIIYGDGQIDNEASEGMKEGVSPYLDEIIEQVEKKHNVKYFKSRREVVKVITDKGEDRNHIYIKGNRTPIGDDIIKPILGRLAKDEYKLIDRMWNEVPSIQLAYCIGGGSLVLRSQLEEINDKSHQYPLRFIEGEDSVWMIARAYHKVLHAVLGEKGITLEAVEA